MAVKQVAVRLKPEGGAETVSTFKQVEEAGARAGNAAAAASDKATAAAAKQEAQWKRNAEAYRAAANAADAQARFNTVLGVGAGQSSAAASAEVFAARFASNDNDARLAAQIRAQIDPLAAAQDRYNRELAETQRLRAAGRLTDEQAIQYQNRLQKELDQTTAALNRNTSGLTRREMAGRLNVTRQLADVGVTAAMDMNPAMIAIQQGPQLLEALSDSGFKARGSMLLLGGAFGVVAGAAALGAKAMWDAEQAALALDRAASGLGRAAGLSAAELEAMAVQGAEAGKIHASAAREMAAAWVSTGRIGGEVIPGMLAMVKDYAAFTGQDAKEATESLGKAMLEPDKAGRAMSDAFGLLNTEQEAAIENAIKHGDQLKAQKILLEALTGAVDGHAEKVGRIETAWGGVAAAAAGAYEWIKDALTLTETEQVEALESHLRSLGRDPAAARFGAGGMEGELALMRVRGALEGWADESRAETAAKNQSDALARRRAERNRARGGRSGAGAAERAARQALQRERAEEDREAQLDLEVARAAQDVDRIRVLEEEAAIRTRIRQLVDADVSAEDARFKALQEQARLNEARAASTDREVGLLFAAHSVEVDRILGMERFNAEQERTEDLARRIKAYTDAGASADEAELAASRDLLQIEEARAEVMARQAASAAREHELTLARLAGRTGDVDRLDRAARIEARAREIEARGRNGKPLNHGEGEDQAGREIAQEVAAEAEGVRREWLQGFIADIRQGGIREALADQFESAVDRMINRLIDSLFDVDFGGLMGGGGKKGGGGLGGFLSSAADLLFGGIGRNANGTDHWRGGLTWLGEEGPELAWLPRGSKVASHPRSMQMLASASGGGGPTVHHHYYQLDGATIGSDELWRRIERGDRFAAAAGARNGAQAAVGIVHASASEVQRGERMLKD